MKVGRQRISLRTSRHVVAAGMHSRFVCFQRSGCIDHFVHHLIAISRVERSEASPFAMAGSNLGWIASSLRMLEPAIFTSFR